VLPDLATSNTVSARIRLPPNGLLGEGAAAVPPRKEEDRTRAFATQITFARRLPTYELCATTRHAHRLSSRRGHSTIFCPTALTRSYEEETSRAPDAAHRTVLPRSIGRIYVYYHVYPERVADGRCNDDGNLADDQTADVRTVRSSCRSYPVTICPRPLTMGDDGGSPHLSLARSRAR